MPWNRLRVENLIMIMLILYSPRQLASRPGPHIHVKSHEVRKDRLFLESITPRVTDPVDPISCSQLTAFFLEVRSQPRVLPFLTSFCQPSWNISCSSDLGTTRRSAPIFPARSAIGARISNGGWIE